MAAPAYLMDGGVLSSNNTKSSIDFIASPRLSERIPPRHQAIIHHLVRECFTPHQPVPWAARRLHFRLDRQRQVQLLAA